MMDLINKYNRLTRNFSGPITLFIIGLAALAMGCFGLFVIAEEPLIFGIIGGVGLILIIVAISSFRTGLRRMKEESNAAKGVFDNADSAADLNDGTFNPGMNTTANFTEEDFAGEFKKYYFQFDKHLKQGHFLEDENCNKVIEALMTKMNFSLPNEFDFVNHLTGVTTHHEIGHTVTSASSGMLTSGSRSSFTYDGVDVFDYLHKNGIYIHTEMLDPMMHFEYKISLRGQLIGTVWTCGVKTHQTTGMASMMVAKGFYRMEALDPFLDWIFLVTMAMARTENELYE